MTKQFETLIDVYDHILPTWATWDLLETASPEKCQKLNIDGAFKYRLSDGKHAVNAWVILDFSGVYRRASIELEIDLSSLYPNRSDEKPPATVPLTARKPEKPVFTPLVPIRPQKVSRAQSDKFEQRRPLVDV
ncbi:MAG: hypothetical protein QNJ46_29340 [Leptolyngbyaceae cyanobacterium MO_188.B28]|nr:hypothetical protein [Leptolyngbyaceae cyanobacterium MO_188.B28]